ncbi:MAG: hypothetical protein ABIL49_00575 [candidate division WOR-3 bacterium]|jgi:dolichyl-phosphate beta-glucosyltransferase
MREIKDTQCGFKGFREDVAEILFKKSKIDGFAFDVEILYLAIKHGYKIVQIPVHWKNDPRSKVNLLKDPLKMLKEITYIRRLHRN